MKIKTQIFVWLLILSGIAVACKTNAARDETANVNVNAAKTNAENSNAKTETATVEKTPAKQTSETNAKEPKTPREFFMLLPERYFRLEAVGDKSKTAKQAKEEFLKTRLEVEDNENGYLRAYADGAQPGIVIALFKHPGGGYLVGIEVVGDGENANHFLEYADGKWSDVAARIVPDYGANKFYNLPRYGTTIEVYKRLPEQEAGDGEQGAKLYNLVWKEGKFTVQK